ncbi:FapA family protein [Alloiococcus sp. CFN-8]|uniref:FapA family protein n=1 Tax=Alloiococcus sp. CFN-8 TaxID=3416081 RepID=UPI003CF503DE
MKEYTSSNLEKCLELAALDLQVNKNEIVYDILKENKSFFKKSITIAIKEADFLVEKENERSSPRKERLLYLEISPCKTAAYLIVQYDGDDTPSDELFTEEEVLKLIEDKKINVNNSVSYSELIKASGRYIIAEGVEAVDDEEDIIELKFHSSKGINDSESSIIKYKERCAIESVDKGDILASIKKGRIGHNGRDVYGNEIKRKKAKKHLFNAGRGCFLDDSGNIIASVSGKPSYKAGTIEVNEYYEHRKDVDIGSGSLFFQGHVKIYGSVLPGMTVDAKGDIEILGSVEEANITASGDVIIHGNVLRSKIAAGAKDNYRIGLMRIYKDLATSLSEMKKVVEDIKKYKLLGNDRDDGQIIKVLLESKFQRIDKDAKEIISILAKNSSNDLPVENFIKKKLIGLGPITIKDYLELDTMVKVLLLRVKELHNELRIRADIHLGYIQDCEIYATGKIIIKGRGEYQSILTSGTSIEFARGAVARGGTITAAQEILAGSVGSAGGVITKLSVDRAGIIKINNIYQNTIIIIGDKELCFDSYQEKVKAKLGEDGFISIENYY